MGRPVKIEGGAATPVSLIPFQTKGEQGTETLGTGVFEPEVPQAPVRSLLVQAEGEDVRMTLGRVSSPQTGHGFLLIAGDPPTLIPLGPDMVLRFLRTASGAVLQYQWVT